MTDLWHWQHLNNYYICAISCMKCIHLYYIFDTNIYDSHFTRTSKFPDFLEPYFPQFFSPFLKLLFRDFFWSKSMDKLIIEFKKCSISDKVGIMLATTTLNCDVRAVKNSMNSVIIGPPPGCHTGNHKMNC